MMGKQMEHNLRILAIDPGPVQSAYIVIATQPRIKVLEHQIIDNHLVFPLLQDVRESDIINSHLLIEDIESFGMPVGRDVFQTVRWTGRFDREWWNITNGRGARYIKRSKIKHTLCGSTRAKDSNIRSALLDIWGPTGTKKAPGLIYGVSKDVWSALAVATTYLLELDVFLGEKLEKLRVVGVL